LFSNLFTLFSNQRLAPEPCPASLVCRSIRASLIASQHLVLLATGAVRL
jgi:hypothetical protein